MTISEKVNSENTEILIKNENNSFKDNTIKLKFYLYAPPEFDVDTKFCSFGIIHSLGDWKSENIIKLNARFFFI